MQNLKALGFKTGVMLLVLALASCYVGWTGLASVRDAEEYEDAGVISFIPCRVLPVQVKNTATGRSKRLNPAKTVYMVYYQATDGSGYQWKESASSKQTGEDIVAAGAETQRRLLRIPDKGSYITIDPEQTAESHTTRARLRYGLATGLSVVYILGYVIIFAVRQKPRRDVGDR